jgi:hypothetical protein
MMKLLMFLLISYINNRNISSQGTGLLTTASVVVVVAVVVIVVVITKLLVVRLFMAVILEFIVKLCLD